MNQLKKYVYFGLILTMGISQAASTTTNATVFCGSSCGTGSCSGSCSSVCIGSKTIFVPLPQGANLYTQYHKLDTYYDYDDCCDDRDWCLNASATYRFQQSRNGNDIAALLFNAPCGTLLFQGSNYGLPTPGSTAALNDILGDGFTVNSQGDRAPNALIADYFGMGPNTNLTLNLNPQIRNSIIDIQVASNMDCICDGLYFQINLPVVYSQWQLNACGGTADTTALETAGAYTLTTDDLGGAKTVEAVITNMRGTSTAPGITFPVDEVKLKNIIAAQTGDLKAVATAIGYMGGITLTGTKAKAGGLTSDPANNQYLLGDAPHVTVNQPFVQPLSLSNALSGATFGDLQFGSTQGRLYNLFNLSTITNSNATVTANCVGSNCGTYPGVACGSCDSSVWILDGIYLQLGWDFCRCDTYHLGLYVKGVIPTGTQICSNQIQNIFNPIVGNGRHGELGGGISAHTELWCNDDSNFVANFDGYVTGLFSNTQFRSFDLTNPTTGAVMPMSRYMLLKQFIQTSATAPNPVPTTGPTNVGAQLYAYQGLVVAGDVNAQDVRISVAARGEAILDLIYKCCDWEVGGGYAFSGQTKENASCCNANGCGSQNNGANSCPTANSNFFYGFKGATFVSDIIFASDSDLSPGVTNGINTISFRTNSDVDPSATAYTYNPLYIVNAPMTTSANVFQLPQICNANSTTAASSCSGSCTTSGSSCSNIANRSGLMEAQVLNRIFGHIDYTWSDCHWMPTLGLVGSVGFTGSSSVTAEYWDVGGRFGFSY